MDKVKAGDLSFMAEYNKNISVQRQIQVCLASYVAENSVPPKVNSTDEFKDVMAKNCGLDKNSVDTINNVLIIDSTANYRIDISFSDGKTYEFTPTEVLNK